MSLVEYRKRMKRRRKSTAVGEPSTKVSFTREKPEVMDVGPTRDIIGFEEERREIANAIQKLSSGACSLCIKCRSYCIVLVLYCNGVVL